MVYFSSDWHMGHRNILQYDKRPFVDIEEHDRTIMLNYNSIVQPQDEFYFLGDFALCSLPRAHAYMMGLNGKKHFIKGNHDKSDTIKLYERYGNYMGEQKRVTVEGQEIVLNHFKMLVWDKCHRGSWHLYGHSHGSAEKHIVGKSFDVGVNIWDYKPLSFEQVKEEMSKRQFMAVDHHEED